MSTLRAARIITRQRQEHSNLLRQGTKLYTLYFMSLTIAIAHLIGSGGRTIYFPHCADIANT